MRIITSNDLQAVPWKNGQGITREIAKEPSAQGFAWRMSVADVASSGPFSRFDGMRRILTVVQGKGMELIGPEFTLQAGLGVPVEFDGGLEISSRLNDGPLRDFNLIFDPQICTGQVTIFAEVKDYSLHCAEGQFLALYCMAGSVALNHSAHLYEGDTVLLDLGAYEIGFDENSRALLVKVQRL